VKTEKEFPELLSTLELSKLLKISESWVRKKVFMRELPYFKVGNCVRFKREEILIWIEKNKKEVQVNSQELV
jgi:excisionase family DNA binding protein